MKTLADVLHRLIDGVTRWAEGEAEQAHKVIDEALGTASSDDTTTGTETPADGAAGDEAPPDATTPEPVYDSAGALLGHLDAGVFTPATGGTAEGATAPTA